MTTKGKSCTGEKDDQYQAAFQPSVRHPYDARNIAADACTQQDQRQ